MTVHDGEWEERLRSKLGTPAEPNFNAWCDNYPEAVRALQCKPTIHSLARDETSTRRRPIVTIMKLTTAALLMTGIMTWLNYGGNSPSSVLFAEEIPGVDRVREISWATTFYTRISSKDGKESWIKKERQQWAYRHPNQLRETRMNSAGEVISIHITDYSVNRTLELLMKEKKAILKTSDHHHDPRGPFAWVGDELRKRNLNDSTRVKSISLGGEAEIDNLKANVVRVVTQDVERGKSSQHELYLDRNTKQLVGIWGPNDPSSTRAELESQVQKSGKAWYRIEPIAALTHEINLAPRLQNADFSLDVPQGFELETIAHPTVTEEEMLAFLKAAVRFHDGQFADSPFALYDEKKLNLEWTADENARSKEANALIAVIDKIRYRQIYQPALKRFISDNVVPDSFRYVGSGVKFGQADSLVCWYQTRIGETWRAVYGDLAVRTVTEDDLPFGVTQ
ncbi:hypothetical protein [Fuerstiella marisgermanici]|uniref:Uncharacterized protein n=1 Tax=Fuerstiella marisgermanici TaxID=1891926 RepID=A0A1P8WFS5_9PLAN|nr:hypothetical protein [Fuerstiella marisgermanici]APZ92919.1 hypothetical protein Fuma_02531 [Fuerstiella marisgermanici]